MLFVALPTPQPQQVGSTASSKKIPTAKNSPHLTPAQLRIARRRYKRDETLRKEAEPETSTPTLTTQQLTQRNDNHEQRTPLIGNRQQLPNESPAQASDHPLPNVPNQRRKRRRLRLTQRLPSTRGRTHSQQEFNNNEPVTPHVHDIFLTSEEQLRKLLQGTWKPP